MDHLGTHPLRFAPFCGYLFITDYYRWKWNIKAISQRISESPNREVDNLAVGWKSDNFPKSRFWAYGRSYLHTYTSGRVIGDAEYDSNILFAIKQILLSVKFTNVKIWKWKVSKFSEELLPAASRYRGFIGTNKKHKPWIFWRYISCIWHFKFATLTSIRNIGKKSQKINWSISSLNSIKTSIYVKGYEFQWIIS